MSKPERAPDYWGLQGFGVLGARPVVAGCPRSLIAALHASSKFKEASDAEYLQALAHRVRVGEGFDMPTHDLGAAVNTLFALGLVWPLSPGSRA